MKTTLRILALLLACLMCLGLLIACNDPNTPDNPPDDDKNNPNQGQTPDDDTPDTPKEPEVLPSVPDDMMFDGTVNVLHYNVGSHETYNPWDEIAPLTGMDSQPGDAVGNLIFARNAWVEENYGITVTVVYEDHGPLEELVGRLYSSGDAEYQLVDDFTFGSKLMMGHDYFINLADVRYVDFDDPWWVDSAIEQYSLGNYVEFGVSDMLLLDKGATALMYYNVDMAKDLEINDMYEVVKDGDWTIEEMAYRAAVATRDNGDDVWDEKDIYGIVTGDDPVINLYTGSGNKFISRDENGDFYYSYCKDEGTAEAMIYILEEVMYGDFLWNTWHHRDGASPSFKDNQALFTFSMAKGANSMRDMESDYGVLPTPKLNEDQEDYYSQVSPYHDSIFAIPVANEGNTDIIGAALELLSYYSYYNIQDTFYTVILQMRGTRDEESLKMLDIIFEHRTYDLGYLYDPAAVTDPILRYTETGETGVISFWEGFSGKLEVAIEELNEMKDRYEDKN